MKETLRASIGGIAFTIDQEAYLLIDEYLANLNRYYKNRPEGSEIVADVEARMSELLQMKLNSPQSIVTLPEIKEIISILGNPSEFGDEEDSRETVENETKPDNTPFYKKKLFRDPAHKIIGGVCSGLGFFFRIDPVFIRLIFIGIFLLLNFFSHRNALFVLLAYLILWVVTPEARTLKEKVSMVGKDPSLEGLKNSEKNVNSYGDNRTPLGSTILKVIKIIISVFMILIGLSLFISAITGFIYFVNFDYPVSLNELLDVFSLDTLDVKLSLGAVIFIPVIAILYYAVRLLQGMNVRDLVVGIVSFIVWIGAATYIGVNISKVAVNYANNSKSHESAEIETASNTLYIKLDNRFSDAMPIVVNSKNFNIYKFENEKHSSYALTPPVNIEIVEDTTIINYKLEISKMAFARSETQAYKHAEESKLPYSVSDSLVVINPVEFTKEKDFDRVLFKLNIKVPANKKVIIDPLLENTWDRKNRRFRMNF
ncbi:PspC domain-containing protein [Dysgonomonas sp. 520]|uniref:PspC domain-containing protein n=1 Tax=Dysgonomonas sp. 520 TaxID=2302931 RepID=UPI0013D46B3D|nr:PspC domain-containing protein [Dysgonomonas sp. 520]NDW08770.1 PspC domain-containing protein [Dysgonomonas sp. 520]